MADDVLFIGAGRMGALMARRLLDGGVALAVADVVPAALEPFAARGVATAAHGADLLGTIVLTMLPTDRHVREALLGPGGACTVRPRAVVIDMSTATPAHTRALAADLAARGTVLLDAPVSGGMAGAGDGRLTTMVGGDAAALARCLPILRLMCADVTRVGPVGSGHAVKALNNYLSAATLWTATEALVIGRRLGLDAATMLAVWSAGSGRSHATEVKLPRHVVTGTLDFGQSLELFCKDIAIAAELARETGTTTPALDHLLALWRSARDTLGPQADITRIEPLLDDR
ncbi:NAD(P)-dependent oxidoreductase [Siculibacillus lacustris]|uniref:NAD(P)-dependent oxidoreductase n=1 Tax=Siculibacillus lacustris TaxID=1549641 RepID=A0A4Q9W058_9HYPH|nr:NAD(P)-dependent oxidoreductase [Siculibacillus lacustris]TBW41353.1 NAD(P)-dependent oxidoreductase [Siculibacillus lacustris]